MRCEIEHERGGVDGHVEDGGRQRQPRFLKSPEGAEGAPHPGVESAFVGDGRGQLAEHQRGGKAPDERQEEENQQGELVAAETDHIFKVVRAARDHEVGGREQGNHAQFAHAAFRFAEQTLSPQPTSQARRCCRSIDVRYCQHTQRVAIAETDRKEAAGMTYAGIPRTTGSWCSRSQSRTPMR